MKIVLLYSGGFDSIGALWKLLTETDHEILVLHIAIDCIWKFGEAETYATDHSIAYMKEHCRPFTVLPSVDYSVSYIPLYNPLCIFFAAIAAMENGADRVYTANINGDNVPRIVEWWENYGQPIFEMLTDGHDILSERPFMDLFKDHWVSIAPPELLAMSISCRHPAKQDDGSWKQCGECNSCLEVVESSNGIYPPDRRHVLPKIQPTFPKHTNRTKTMVVVSNHNKGMEELEILLDTTDDFIGVQFVDMQNINKPNNYRETVEGRLNELSEKYMIRRRQDIIIKSPFAPSFDPIIAMFAFSLEFRVINRWFNRAVTGELIDVDYIQFEKIYKIFNRCKLETTING